MKGCTVCIVLAEQVGKNTFSVSYKLSPVDVAHCRVLLVLMASMSMAAILMEGSHPSDLQMKKEDCQVTQALISQTEDGQLDSHSHMRTK